MNSDRWLERNGIKLLVEPFRSELAEEGRRFGVTCVGTDGTEGFHLELAASFASRRLKYKEAFDPEAKAKKTLFDLCARSEINFS